MVRSRYNLTFELNDALLLINTLSGAVDFADRETFDFICGKKKPGGSNIDVDLLLKRGYLSSSYKDEQRALIDAYYRYIKLMQGHRVFLISPTYDCNLACIYCFEKKPPGSGKVMSLEVLDKAFDFINLLTQKDEHPPFVIIFGGEPLLKRPQQVEVVRQILSECERRGYTSQITTNGVELSSLWPQISQHHISRLQITIDGPWEIHNARRKFPDGRGTFDMIVKGVDIALKSGVSVHLRVNIDLSNIGYLPELAQIIQDRGWLNTGKLFAYLAPLHLKEGQYRGEGSLVELLKKTLELYRVHPETQVFDAFEFQPVLMIRQFLKERVLALQFKQCGANNYQYLLGPYGDISLCLGACGDEESTIGTFYPELCIDVEKLSAWRNRSILTIPECRRCKFGPICGGGCSLGALKDTGILAAPCCPPLGPMLKLTLEHYLPQLKARGCN